MGKQYICGCRSGKTRRNTRSVATRISLQRSFGARQKQCRYRLQCPNTAPCVQCKEVGQLGELQRGMKERRKAEWTFERLQEAHDKVAMEDVGRLSIAWGISEKSTDFLRRIIAPVDGMAGVTWSYVCPQCSCYIWWASTGPTGRRSVGGMQHAEANTNGERPT